MAEAYLGSSGITIPIPIGYILEPIKLETNERTLDGTLITNYAVNPEDTAITKYHFELPGITKSLRLAIRAEALKTGNMSYIDHIQIPEVLIHEGSTSSGSISLQRGLGSTSNSDINATLVGVTKTITISTGNNPTSTGIYTTIGGVLTIGSTSTGNLIINYIPKYTVHVVSDRHELLYKTSSTDHTVRYNLVLEEA